MAATLDPVDELLEFPDTHPYRKWQGSHWRLVELADLGVDLPATRLRAGVDQVLAWLGPTVAELPPGGDRPRRHASMPGNAVYALSSLGFAEHPGTARLVAALLRWQWPDGGWNCDRRPTATRSSFHESVTPAIGLATYAHRTGDVAARAAAERTAELLLDHRLFRSRQSGEAIHPSWTTLHYPAYWHYDVLQGLRLLQVLDRIDDPRAGGALALVERARRRDGSFSCGQWASARQPAVLSREIYREILARRAQEILDTAGREKEIPGSGRR